MALVGYDEGVYYIRAWLLVEVKNKSFKVGRAEKSTDECSEEALNIEHFIGQGTVEILNGPHLIYLQVEISTLANYNLLKPLSGLYRGFYSMAITISVLLFTRIYFTSFPLYVEQPQLLHLPTIYHKNVL